MKHESRTLGTVTYARRQEYTFPKGILGLEEFTRYALVEDERTSPARWLISLEEGGPELALLDPGLLMEYRIGLKDLDKGTLRLLGARSLEELDVFCVLAVPDEIRKTSLNMRAPVLLNPATGRGCQQARPVDSGWPVRKRVYSDLVGADPAEDAGMVVSHRKVGQTLEIGPDITVQVMELADGGVRLGVSAPRRISVSRGRHPATPRGEVRRASEDMRLDSLERLMREFNARRGAEALARTKGAATQKAAPNGRGAAPGLHVLADTDEGRPYMPANFVGAAEVAG